jgi:Fimbrial assembly protein (PilN)
VSAPLVNVDFVSQRSRVTLAGAALLLLGAGAAAAAWFGYQAIEARRAGLELKLQAAARHAHPALDAGAARLGEEAGRVAEELGAPWTRLLTELETASRDTAGQIAVLSIEPDSVKHRVHITGESRDLPLVLAYVQRLQASPLLRYPMLDSHEVKTDDAQRPVRFAMSAEWRALP